MRTTETYDADEVREIVKDACKRLDYIADTLDDDSAADKIRDVIADMEREI